MSEKKNQWRTETFRIYVPYAMSGISKESLTETALDRAFSIPMMRKPVRVRKPFNKARCEKECAPLREQSYAWALQNADALATAYDSGALDRQINRLALNDRATDIWKPLFAIAAVMGLDAEKVQGLEALAMEMGGDPEAAENARQLAVVGVLRKAILNEECNLMTSQVVEFLNGEGMPVQESEISDLLREWQIPQKSVRIGTDAAPRRCWIFGPSILAKIEEQLLGWSEDVYPEKADYTDYTESDSEAEATDDTATAKVAVAREAATPVGDNFKKSHETVDDDEAYQ